MSDEFRKQLTNGFIKDIEYSISRAMQGQLSPYWQEYTHRDIQSYRDSGIIPAVDLARFEKALNEAICSCQQITNAALDRQQLEGYGGKLLYFYPSKDYSTLVEVTECRGVYNACAYIDCDGACSNLGGYCTAIQNHFLTWVATLNLSECIVADEVPHEKLRYASLEEALRFIMGVLAHPDDFVI